MANPGSAAAEGAGQFLLVHLGAAVDIAAPGLLIELIAGLAAALGLLTATSLRGTAGSR
ncbi:hypothetical protein [Nocardia sp. NPDC058480]|uniref:hypothetical protein n=1 Tax=Nocardia sp. NPDC058480 TaxID=3346522 RepID=UPI003667381E